MMWSFDGGWGMFSGGFWMVLFWAVIIGLVVWGISRIAGNGGGRQDREDAPVEIAKRRLARGEITPEQFEELKKTLR